MQRPTNRNKWRNPSGTRTYYAWRSMRARCVYPDHAAYHNYGGRGILVCQRWLDDYDSFYEDMGPAPAGMSLDRINVNGNYEPANCRWATDKEQSHNRRNNRYLTHDGQTHTMAEWAAKLGIGKDTLFRRLNVYGHSVARALTPGSLNPSPQCGTIYAYGKGCRCTECRAANAEKARRARQRRKSLQAARAT